MKKLLALLAICFLFGCQVKNEQTPINQSEEKQKTVLQKETTKQDNNERPELDLDAVLAFSYFQVYKILPKEDLERLYQKTIEFAETPEIILFEANAEEMGYNDAEIKNYLHKVPSRFTERNDCQRDIEYYKIFQTITDKEGKVLGALAFGKEKDSYYYESPIFAFPNGFRQANPNELLYDDLKIIPQKNECVVYYGTLTYTSKDEKERTVPKVGILSRNITENPEYTNWLVKLLEKVGEDLKIQPEK